jgi:hypothetical protein
MQRLLTAHQVAEILALDGPRAFAQRRRRLEEEHGFPPPVPGVGQRWDPLAIEAWRRRIRGEAAPALHDGPGNDNVEDLLIVRARTMAAAD